MPETGPEPGEDSGTTDKRELLAAFDGVVNREREKAVERRSLPMARRTGAVVLAVCILAWGVLAYTWLGRPEWLFPADPVTRLSASEKEARLRFGLYLQRERVLDFLATHRRLPGSLSEAGDVEEGVEYLVSGDSTFLVSILVRDSVITLNESQTADVLLKPAGMAPSRAP